MSFANYLRENAWDLSHYHPDDHEDIRQILTKVNSMYALAGREVAGLTVRREIPNQDSIDASLGDYEILPGVRAFPLHGFAGANSYYDMRDRKHCLSLAQQIAHTKEINPIIVVEEKKGPYILEGGHRVSALVELRVPEVPAMIVVDIDSFFR